MVQCRLRHPIINTMKKATRLILIIIAIVAVVAAVFYCKNHCYILSKDKPLAKKKFK